MVIGSLWKSKLTRSQNASHSLDWRVLLQKENREDVRERNLLFKKKLNFGVLVVWIGMTPWAQRWEFLITSKWHYWKGLRGMALEEECNRRWTLRFSKAQTRSSGFLFYRFNYRIAATFPVLCLPVCHQASCHDDIGLNLWNYKQDQLKCFFL